MDKMRKLSSRVRAVCGASFVPAPVSLADCCLYCCWPVAKACGRCCNNKTKRMGRKRGRDMIGWCRLAVNRSDVLADVSVAKKKKTAVAFVDLSGRLAGCKSAVFLVLASCFIFYLFPELSKGWTLRQQVPTLRCWPAHPPDPVCRCFLPPPTILMRHVRISLGVLCAPLAVGSGVQFMASSVLEHPSDLLTQETTTAWDKCTPSTWFHSTNTTIH